MDKNEELQKKARGGEIAIKGTVTPDVTTEPVAPVRAWDKGRAFTDPDGETLDQKIERNQIGARRPDGELDSSD